MVDFYFAKATIDCATKGSEGVVKTSIQHIFLGKSLNRSIKFRFGEHEDRNSNSIFKLLAKSFTKTQC